jgi:DNA-binding Lrp family transcriptional regulator
MQRQTKLQVAPDAPMSGVKLDSFYQTPTWMGIRAIRAKLTAADLYLWMYLQMLDPDGEVLIDLPSLKDISEAIGISERQVKWSIAKLEKEGLYHYQVDPWKGQNLSGRAAKELCEKQHQPQNSDQQELAGSPLEDDVGNGIIALSTPETLEALPQESTSSPEEQHITAGTLSKIEAFESRLAGRGEVPPWRIKHGVNGINREFAEWLRQKQMYKLKKELSLFETLGWISDREPGGKYFASHSQLVEAVREWQQSKLEWDAPTPGQLLASEVAIALNNSQADLVVDRFKKTADKYDWEIAPGEPVPQILEWYAKKIQYSKRPEFTGKPPMALARQDFCDRILAAGVYEEYQKWAQSVLSNHNAKVQTNAPQGEDPTTVTIEVASRPTGTLVNRIKAYTSQAHVAILRKSLQDTINTALNAADVSWEEKIQAFQLVLDNQYLHDWAVKQAEFHGLEIVDGKVEVAF